MSDNSSGNSPAAPAQSNSAPVAESNEVVSNDVSVDSGNDGLELDSAEAIQADPNLTKAEKKKMLKKVGIKYNGKDEDVELPFEIPEEHAEYMRRQLQMAKMGQHKAQEYSTLEKDVVAFLQELKTNPRKALSNPNIGVDVKKFAAEILEEELANAQKSPEQLEKEKYEQELKDLREEKKAREEQMKHLERERAVEQAAQKFDIDMATTLEKFDIPKQPLAIKRMAELMSIEIQRGYEPNMDVIGQLVEDEMNGDIREYIKAMSHEKRLKFLGEDIFEEDRKARVAKIKKAPATAKQAVKDVQKVEKKEEKEKPKLTYREFFKGI